MKNTHMCQHGARNSTQVKEERSPAKLLSLFFLILLTYLGGTTWLAVNYENAQTQKQIYSLICFSPSQITSPHHPTTTRVVTVTSVSIKPSTLTGEENTRDEKKCLLSEIFAGEKYEISYLNEKGKIETIQIPTARVKADFSAQNSPSTLEIATTTFPRFKDENFLKSPAIKFLTISKQNPSKMEYDTYFLNTTPL